MHQGKQQAFTQTTVGDTDPLARPGALDGLKDGGTRKNKIGTVRSNAAFRRAALRAEVDQATGCRLAILSRHPEAIDQITLIAA